MKDELSNIHRRMVMWKEGGVSDEAERGMLDVGDSMGTRQRESFLPSPL